MADVGGKWRGGWDGMYEKQVIDSLLTQDSMKRGSTADTVTKGDKGFVAQVVLCCCCVVRISFDFL